MSLLICMLAGLTVGNVVGDLVSGVEWLKFLNVGQSFGLSSPVDMDLGCLFLTLRIELNITIAGVLGLIGGVYSYKRI